MIWLIGQIALRTGLGSLLSSLVAYALIAALAAGGFWAWSAHKYHAGYSAGSAHERVAWEEQRKRDLAKQTAKVAEDQRKIDQIEADNLALQGQLAETRAALETAIHAEGADKKPAMSKGVARALNGVGR